MVKVAGSDSIQQNIMKTTQTTVLYFKIVNEIIGHWRWVGFLWKSLFNSPYIISLIWLNSVYLFCWNCNWMSFFNSFFSIQSFDIRRLLWLKLPLINQQIWAIIVIVTGVLSLQNGCSGHRDALNKLFALLSWSNQCWWSVKRDANLGQWVCKCTAGIFTVPKCIIQFECHPPLDSAWKSGQKW